MQHGVGERGFKSVVTGEPVAGPPTLPEEELRTNRADCDGDALRHRLIDDYYRARLPKFEDIDTPLLSAANWGGMGLHPRGNFEGYLRAGTEQKWLEVHGDTHFTLFYANYGAGAAEALLRSFPQGRGQRLGTAAEGAAQHPPSGREIRAARRDRMAARAHAMDQILSASAICSLRAEPATADATLPYATTGDGLTFSTPPLTTEMEITGPVAAKLFVSSDTTDADLFLVLRVFDPQGKEVVFVGSNDPRVPVGLGWLRASHRKLDPNETLPYRPYHTHDEEWPLTPGKPVELDVEIWPTSHRGAAGLSHRALGARQGLRIRRHRHGAAARALSDEGRRPVHPHQSAATARRRSSAAPTRCTSAPTWRPTCCCR